MLLRTRIKTANIIFEGTFCKCVKAWDYGLRLFSNYQECIGEFYES